MNYAVIGTGYWGSNHARVGAELLDEGEIDSLVFCDVDESRAAEQADQYGVKYVTDHHDLVNHNVDAATIATPSPTHHDIAVALLEDGLDLLIEKPLAVTSEQAWNVVRVARENDTTLGVGHIFRYHPALSDLKRRIDRGELGRIRYVNTNRFSFRVPRKAAGALFSLAVHDVDICNYLLEAAPNRLFCQLDSFIREDIDETATIVMEYDGTTANINESWQVPVFGKRRDLTVVGTERSAHLDYLEDNVVDVYDSTVQRDGNHLSTRDNGRQRYEVDNREPLRVEAEDFLKAASNGSTPKASGEVGAATVALLERAREADAAESTVRIDDAELGYSWSR